jgi:hypothetical protein
MTSVAAVAPARAVTTPPTYLHHSLRRLADGSRPPTPQGSRPAFAGGDVARRPNPYPAHYRSAFACSLVLYPQPHRLILRLAFPCGRAMGLPRCVAETLRGVGRASTPVARHLRRVSSGHPDLATYLLVQAYQHLGPVLCDDACGTSPGLTLPRAAGPQPPWCWQSQSGFTPSLPPLRGEDTLSRGLRTPRCQASTPR